MYLIYVFNEQDADKLRARGYLLVKKNDSDPMWVFENMLGNFANLGDIEHVASDVLTF